MVSAASAWEIATKYRLGKLPGTKHLIADYASAIRDLQAERLTITPPHALKAGAWTVSRRDPFARMLAARALLESLPLATVDSAMQQFGIELLCLEIRRWFITQQVLEL